MWFEELSRSESYSDAHWLYRPSKRYSTAIIEWARLIEWMNKWQTWESVQNSDHFLMILTYSASSAYQNHISHHNSQCRYVHHRVCLCAYELSNTVRRAAYNHINKLWHVIKAFGGRHHFCQFTQFLSEGTECHSSVIHNSTLTIYTSQFCLATRWFNALEPKIVITFWLLLYTRACMFLR